MSFVGTGDVHVWSF